jgi:hypothetical protein
VAAARRVYVYAHVIRRFRAGGDMVSCLCIMCIVVCSVCACAWLALAEEESLAKGENYIETEKKTVRLEG